MRSVPPFGLRQRHEDLLMQSTRVHLPPSTTESSPNGAGAEGQRKEEDKLVPEPGDPGSRASASVGFPHDLFR